MILRPDTGRAMEGIGDSRISAADAVRRTADMSLIGDVQCEDRYWDTGSFYASCWALRLIAAIRFPPRAVYSRGGRYDSRCRQHTSSSAVSLRRDGLGGSAARLRRRPVRSSSGQTIEIRKTTGVVQ